MARLKNATDKRSTQKRVDEAHIKHFAEGRTLTQIADKMGLNRATVYRYVRKKKPSEKAQEIIDKVKEDDPEEQDVDTAVEIIKGRKMTSVIDKGMSLLDDEETLQREIDKKGIGSVVNMVRDMLNLRVRIYEADQKYMMHQETNDVQDGWHEAMMNTLKNMTRTQVMEDLVDKNSLRDTELKDDVS